MNCTGHAQIIRVKKFKVPKNRALKYTILIPRVTIIFNGRYAEISVLPLSMHTLV